VLLLDKTIYLRFNTPTGKERGNQMSEQVVIATITCTGAEMHLVNEQVIRPEIEDGFLVGGYLGSAQHFCTKCDAPTEIIAYRLGKLR
jgi:hypothetical protein